MIFILFLFPLFIFAGSKYIGSFKAGETISGYGDSSYANLTYDFIVEKYGLVEFKPQNLYDINEQRGSIQYKIQDLAEQLTSGFFHLSGAEGITYHGFIDYPNGWKLHMFPGTYRVKVYAGGSDNKYGMDTTFVEADALYTSSPTGTTLNNKREDAVAIATNTTYHDTIGYVADTLSIDNNYQNYHDYFKFTLNEETDFEIEASVDGTFLSQLDSTKINFYLYDALTSISYSDYLIYYKDTSKNTKKTFHKVAGEYYLGVSGTNSGNYSFKIITKNGDNTTTTPTTPTTPTSTTSDIWEQKDKFNPAYPPVFHSDASVSLPFAPWTNAKPDANGYYDGNTIITKDRYNLLDKTVQMKFSIDGAGSYSYSYIGISDLSTALAFQELSTGHQYGPTKLIDNNRSIYYQMRIDENASYSLTLSYLGYGQSDLHEDKGVMTTAQLSSASSAYIYFSNGDNYAGTKASAKLYEFKVKDHSNSTLDYSQENKATQTIGNINFLELEPDGYFSWSEANAWCVDRGYRLPTMEELIASWVASGSNASPTGFEKDTFYWASDSASATEHKGCPMDVDCSEESTIPDSGYGHPKCVVSVNSDTNTDTDANTPTTDNPHSTQESSSGGGAFGYILPLFVLGLLYFRRKEQD